MFKPVKAKTVEEYLASVAPERLAPMRYLHEFIQQHAPTLKPIFAYNMPGYGTFKYTNYKKEVVDWPVVALASQKNYMRLYVCAVENGK